MSSRFNQTKPGVLALSTKRKVMNEFRKIKNQLDQINQDVLNPAEQTMPATATSEHSFQTSARSGKQPEFRLDDQLFMTCQSQRAGKNFKTMDQQAQNLKSPQASNAETLNYSVRSKRPQSTKSHATVRNRLRKNNGYGDFSLQTNRKGFPIHQLSEARFQLVNHFPAARSDTRPVPNVNFNQQTSRKDELTRTIQMSDSCFKFQQMRQVRRNEKGILQFGTSTDSKFAPVKKPFVAVQKPLIDNVALQQEFDMLLVQQHQKELAKLKRGGEQDQPEQTESQKEVGYENLNQRMRNAMKQAHHAADKRRKEQDALFKINQDQKNIERLANYKRGTSVEFNRQQPRTKEKEHYSKVVSAHERQMSQKLPSYFHNNSNRVAMTAMTETSLRQTKSSTQPMCNVPSSFNDKRSFRVDPDLPIEQQFPSDNKKVKQKKAIDFGQMLEQCGYTMKVNAHKPRKRPWHIKKIKFDSSSSSEDN